MKVNLNKRVRVWKQDKSKYLGEGTFVGTATIYIIRVVGGTLVNLDPEVRPELPEHIGHVIEELRDMPKILLDSGEFVYGCFLQWHLVNDGEAIDKGPIRSNN